MVMTHCEQLPLSYDKGIPAKIGLTKISRRTKILVYGKNW